MTGEIVIPACSWAGTNIKNYRVQYPEVFDCSLLFLNISRELEGPGSGALPG